MHIICIYILYVYIYIYIIQQIQHMSCMYGSSMRGFDIVHFTI
jgi:hypothetical protein